MEVKRTGTFLGAEITGVDLSRPLDDATFKAVHAAWLRHQVLVFRHQTLDGDQQIAFGRRFGELQEVRTTPCLNSNP